MNEKMKPSVNAQRLWDTIMATARFGATPKGGVRRLALSDEDRMVRDWFVTECQKAGCSVGIDRMGNIFAVRSGRDNSLAPIAIGSHLDTQPSGGKFDGISGVLSGLEVIRTLNEAHYQTEAPLVLIDWTNEEGGRFAPPMLGSGVYTGVFTEEFAYKIQDPDGKQLEAELVRIGYQGNGTGVPQKLAAYFELHIEQGPVLEIERQQIGVVSGVQGMHWYEVNIRGNESHAGTTPMKFRKDAMLGCAKIVLEVNQITQKHEDAVTTVGMLTVQPNSRNVIPGYVSFSVDLRHPEAGVLHEMEAELKEIVERISGELKLTSELKDFWYSPAVKYDEKCIGAVRDAAEELGYRHRDIVSGAGHDAVYIAGVAPTGMIFIPCQEGISHNEAESTTCEDVARGANVLLYAALRMDKELYGN